MYTSQVQCSQWFPNLVPGHEPGFKSLLGASCIRICLFVPHVPLRGRAMLCYISNVLVNYGCSLEPVLHVVITYPVYIMLHNSLQLHDLTKCSVNITIHISLQLHRRQCSPYCSWSCGPGFKSQVGNISAVSNSFGSSSPAYRRISPETLHIPFYQACRFLTGWMMFTYVSSHISTNIPAFIQCCRKCQVLSSIQAATVHP